MVIQPGMPVCNELSPMTGGVKDHGTIGGILSDGDNQ
jgi:hypothetical protein